MDGKRMTWAEIKEHKIIVKISEDSIADNEFLIKELSEKICVQINGVMLQS